MAGIASRGFSAAAVACAIEGVGACVAALALLIAPASGLDLAVLGWGLLSGVGGAGGTLALLRGLAGGRMSVVATVSGVLMAVIPVVVAVAIGETLSGFSAAGIAIALPAIALVSLQRVRGGRAAAHRDTRLGVLAGLGFALLFIALDRAGTGAGAWPVLFGQLSACLLLAPIALRALARHGLPRRSTTVLMLAAGFLSVSTNLLFLAATAHGELAIVAVLTSLYPAATVLLARLVLSERWSRVQAIGLALAFAAIALVSVG